MKLQQLKGSATSYFLIIPKALIKAKNWKKGDNIEIIINNKGNLEMIKKE